MIALTIGGHIANNKRDESSIRLGAVFSANPRTDWQFSRT
jgi:hypothetical protein